LTGDPAAARAGVSTLVRAAADAAAAGQPGDAADVAMFAGMAAASTGHPDALDLARAHLADTERAGAPWARSWALWVLALAECVTGSIDQAARTLRRALDAQRDLGDRWGQAWAVWLTGIIAARRGLNAESATLLGAARTLHHHVDVTLDGLRPYARLQGVADTANRRALRAHEARNRYTAGADMTRAHALEATAAVLGDPSVAGNPAGLTDRELQVVALVSEGGTNIDVGVQLDISHRTVENHLNHAMRKINKDRRDEPPISNRVGLARWYFRFVADAAIV
jgi:DNA-binding CsgD family transcriptional regulator